MRIIILIIVLKLLFLPISLIADQIDGLPSREADKVISHLAKFDDKNQYDYIESILGMPDSDIGSGIFILTFSLNDGTLITVGTPDKKEVLYINHSGPGIGVIKQIYKKTEQHF